MNQINFLPETFARQARKRRRKYRHAVMLALFAVGLTAWGFGERGRNVAPRSRAIALEAQVEEARGQMNEVEKLRREQAMLVQQQRIKDELTQPIAHTQVIAMLDGHLPPSIGLTNLTITTVRPGPKSAKPTRTSAELGPATDELQIEMDGIAPDDVTIANLIGDLSDDELFDRVTLKYSRTTEAQGVEGRLFKMLMRVRLDRRFVPEVAHAN